MADSEAKPCCLCGLAEDDQLKYGQLFKLDGFVVHHFCMLFSPHLAQNGKDDEGAEGFLASDIKKEVARAKGTSCCYCGQAGASGLCMSMKCKKHYHPSCAVRANGLLQFFGQFKSFCEEHRPRQNVIGRELGESCGICLERTDPDDDHHVLWTPCCRHFFHRACLQRMAYHFGYFFYCPGCRNKDNVSGFLKHMRHFGIFIPKRDASWEMVPNAFGELLERHLVCDVRYCLCSQGRSHQENDSDSPWRLVVCDTCGSAGTHLACSDLPESVTGWVCASCTVQPAGAGGKSSLGEFVAARAAAGAVTQPGEGSSGGSPPQPLLTAALSLREVLAELDEPARLVKFAVNPLSGLSVQTRPVSGPRLAAREPGRRPVAFSAEELLPESVVSSEDSAQAELRLWSEHHVVTCDDDLPEWSFYSVEKHRAATIPRPRPPQETRPALTETVRGGTASSAPRGRPSRGRPRGRPRRLVAVARSSPTKLQRNSKAREPADPRGGAGEESSDRVDTGESDCDDPEVVSDSGTDVEVLEGPHGPPQRSVDTQKTDGGVRDTVRAGSGETRRPPTSESKGPSVSNIPAKRPLSVETVATPQSHSSPRATSSGSPAAKVRRISAESPASASSVKIAGPSRSSPVAAAGVSSSSDDVVVISESSNAGPSRISASGTPAAATGTGLGKADSRMREMHMARAAMNGYPCPICDKKHQTLTQVTLHYHTHDEVGAALFRCKICDAKFSYWQPGHMRNKHPHIQSDDVFANMENNFDEGKRNVARLMLKKKKLDSEELVDLIMRSTFHLNRFRVNNPPPKPAPTTTSTLARLASAREREQEVKKVEESKRQKLNALKALRIGKSSTSDSAPSDVKPTSPELKIVPTVSATSGTKRPSPGSSAGAKQVEPEQPSEGAKETRKPATPGLQFQTKGTANSNQRDGDTTTCSVCNFRGIPAAVNRHEYWHTPGAEKRRDTLRYGCHLCFYASNKAAHVQVHLMCAHFIERPSWDSNGGKPATLLGVRGRITAESRAKTPSSLPADQRGYIELRRYDCPFCDCFFSDSHEFRAHIARRHVKGKPTRPCPFMHCFSEDTHNHSKWYHKSAPLRNRLCPDCGGTVYHGKEQHHKGGVCVRDGALVFECPMPICGFGTCEQREIDSHLVECHSLWVRGVSGPRTSPYYCPQCPAHLSHDSFLKHIEEHEMKDHAKETGSKVAETSDDHQEATDEKVEEVSDERNKEKKAVEEGAGKKTCEPVIETSRPKTTPVPSERGGDSNEMRKPSAKGGGDYGRTKGPGTEKRDEEVSAERDKARKAVVEGAKKIREPAVVERSRPKAGPVPSEQSSGSNEMRRPSAKGGGHRRTKGPRGAKTVAEDALTKATHKSAAEGNVPKGARKPLRERGSPVRTRRHAVEDEGQLKETQRLAAEDSEAQENQEPIPSASSSPEPPPTLLPLWSLMSVGHFLSDRCRLTIRNATLSSVSEQNSEGRGETEQCFFCEFSAASQEEIETHIKAKHKQQMQLFDIFLRSCCSQNKRKKCPICDIGFRSKWVFFRHILSHKINVPNDIV